MRRIQENTADLDPFPALWTSGILSKSLLLTVAGPHRTHTGFPTGARPPAETARSGPTHDERWTSASTRTSQDASVELAGCRCRLDDSLVGRCPTPRQSPRDAHHLQVHES
jgi:hypothetical protein